MLAWVPEHDKQQSKASAKITDAANTSKPEFKSHQAAWNLAITESEATWTSTSTTVKKTPTVTFSAPTTTTSQLTAAKCKQSTSVLDVEDEDSHAIPKGTLPLHLFLIAYSHFFSSFNLKEILC
jgi:hypothetical protein